VKMFIISLFAVFRDSTLFQASFFKHQLTVSIKGSMS